MTSQVRPRIEYLIPTYNTVVLLLLSNFIPKYRLIKSFNETYCDSSVIGLLKIWFHARACNWNNVDCEIVTHMVMSIVSAVASSVQLSLAVASAAWDMYDLHYFGCYYFVGAYRPGSRVHVRCSFVYLFYQFYPQRSSSCFCHYFGRILNTTRHTYCSLRSPCD